MFKNYLPTLWVINGNYSIITPAPRTQAGPYTFNKKTPHKLLGLERQKLRRALGDEKAVGAEFANKMLFEWQRGQDAWGLLRANNCNRVRLKGHCHQPGSSLGCSVPGSFQYLLMAPVYAIEIADSQDTALFDRLDL